MPSQPQIHIVDLFDVLQRAGGEEIPNKLLIGIPGNDLVRQVWVEVGKGN